MLITIGCGEDNSVESQDGRLHPHNDLIPTYDVETHPVTKDEADGALELQELLRRASEQEEELQSTGVFVRSAASIDADQLSDDRIVVLDGRDFLLMVYHAESGRVDTVAVNDGAPNNVANATGLDVYRDTVYVSTMDYRLQMFDCTLACSYAGTTTLNLSARDVAGRGGRVSLLGFTYVEGEENHGMLSELVHRRTREEVNLSFMKAYASTNPFVDFEMNEGFVAHAGGYDVFAFHHMPYLYVFEDGEVIAMFEIKEFHPMERREGVNPYSISMPTAAVMSSISRVQHYGSNELLVVVTTTDRGRRVESAAEARQIDGDDVSVSVDYYLIDMISMTPALGGVMTYGAGKRLHIVPTSDYVIVVGGGEVKYRSRQL
jgi:hypothetical protein